MAKFKPDKKEFTKEAFISFTKSVLDGKATVDIVTTFELAFFHFF